MKRLDIKEHQSINELEKLEIIKLYESGLSIRALDKTFKISRKRISNILKEADCKIRAHGLKLEKKRFGKLIVIERIQNKSLYQDSQWLCQCDCGNTTAVITERLTNGQTKSCGCLVKEVALKKATTHGNGKTREYIMYHRIKCRAIKDNIEFNLDLDDIIIPEYCPIFSNIKLKFNKGTVKYNSPSIDRLIPEKGYTKGNIKIISYRANTIKQNATFEEIRQVADWLEKELKSK